MPVQLIVMAISMAMQVMQKQAAKKKEANAKRAAEAAAKAREDQNRGLKFNARSTNAPLRVLYGRHRVGSNEIYFAVSGTNNEILWIVDSYCEGPCSAIHQVGGVNQLFLDGKIYTSFGGKVTYYFHNGASNQVVDATLAAAVPEWTDRNHYTCYGVWRMEYDENYFMGLPNRQVILNCRTLYDPRTSTTAWSQNPALVEWDFRTNSLYGLGESTSILDETSFEEAATYCDTKGWVANLVYDKSKSAQDFLDEINLHMRGETILYNGTWFKRYFDLNYESTCPAITDAHICQDESGKALLRITQPSRYSKPDGINIHIIDPDKNYTDDYFQVGDELGQIGDLDLYGATRQQAGEIGVYTLERMRLDRGFSGTFRDDCAKYECCDVVPVTCTALGLSAQLMRVVEQKIREDGLVDIGFEYESQDLYDLVYNLTAGNVYTCTLPDPTSEPPAVANAILAESNYNYRLRSFTTLSVTFDPPTGYPWFDHVEVWLSFDDATWEYLYPCNASFDISNVQEGVLYYIRLKTVSIYGAKQLDANDRKLSKTVQGYIDVPDSLGALQCIANSNCINLYSNKVTDTDVELYEFRLGASWSTAIFLAALRSPNLSLTGVKPGNHTFMASTLSNNGSYGSTPVSASVSLIDPPDGWSVTNTETCDYNGVGTHSNTEHTTYSSDDYLKCSHAGGVFVGTYLSPIYDRTVSARYMCYVATEIVVTGAGTTWDDIAPSPKTWTDMDASVKTWDGIVNLTAGPQVRIKLKYGAASPPTSYVEKQEIVSCIVTGRYFQVEIVITDPGSEINALVKEFALKFCQ